jgi:hypothetical protein
VRLASLLFLAGAFAATPALWADQPLVLEIWPGKVPDEIDDIGPERTRMSPQLGPEQAEVTESTKLITNVTRPTVTIFRPGQNKGSKTAMLICPGGGYWNL